MKTLARIGITAAGVVFLLAGILFAFTRVNGPFALPLCLVYRLAGWQAYSETQWNGKGTLLVHMQPEDLGLSKRMSCSRSTTPSAGTG